MTQTELMFYHLQTVGLDTVLPALLEKTLEKNWKAVVHCGSKERLDALNTLLWTYKDASFLPHGSAQDGFAELQPIWLTCDTHDNPNQAQCCFLLDAAPFPEKAQHYKRLVLLFHDTNKHELAHARNLWKEMRSQQNFKMTYWQQDGQGRWFEKKQHTNG